MLRNNKQIKDYLLWSVTDFAAWIMHGGHGGTGSYDAEVKEMIRWQKERIDWMDKQINL